MSKNLPTPALSERDLLSVKLAVHNQLLSQLMASPDEKEILLPHLRTVTFQRNQVIYEQGDSIDLLYFPIDCVVSSLAIMEDGTTMETCMTGREGLVGIPAIMGSGISKQWFWVSISGLALQLETRFLDRLIVQNENALKAFLSYYRSMITQVSQRSVCNTRHTVLERLCCWLLMTQDRVGDADLRLTQEMIASRLGARRAGITVAAGLLGAMQAIQYRRGQVHIADREILEQAVCECYTIMRTDLKSNPSDASAHWAFHYK